MRNFKIFILLCTAFPTAVFAQKEYARELLNSLCSPTMHGRGYVNAGDSLAAEFIALEYERLSLEKVNGTYFQNFSHSVNSFPNEVSVSVDGIELEAGSEFLIHPGSGEGALEHDVVMISPKELLNKEKLLSKLSESHNTLVVIDRREKEIDREQEKLIAALNQYIMFDESHHLAGFVQIYQAEHKGLWSVGTQPGTHIGASLFSEKIPKKIKRIKIVVEPVYIDSYDSRNVVGLIKGESSDSCIILSAHYDHLGRMGPDAYFPGASDNASGTAMLLSLAKHFSSNKPKYDMLFICFAGEEAGLKGSNYYVQHPLMPLENIRFVLNLDIMGTGDDGIQVVNGTIYKNEFELLVALNQKEAWLKEVKIRGERCNSDHCAFHEKGIPSFFSYTLGGQSEYHNIYDTSESLSLSQFDNVYGLFKVFLSNL